MCTVPLLHSGLLSAAATTAGLVALRSSAWGCSRRWPAAGERSNGRRSMKAHQRDGAGDELARLRRQLAAEKRRARSET